MCSTVCRRSSVTPRSSGTSSGLPLPRSPSTGLGSISLSSVTQFVIVRLSVSNARRIVSRSTDRVRFVQFWRYFYWASAFTVFLVTVGLHHWDDFLTDKYRGWRMFLFVIWAIYGFVPLCHWYFLYGGFENEWVQVPCDPSHRVRCKSASPPTNGVFLLCRQL